MAFDTAASDVATIQVRFPNAQAVYVLGSFNNWSTTATPLWRRGDGIWRAILPPNVNLQELCFFVIGVGETFGRIKDWSLAKMGQGHDAVPV